MKSELNEEKLKNNDLVQINNQLEKELNEIKNKQTNFNLNQKNDEIEIVKLYKKIEELNEKLARYPFELLKGEKMITIIFTSVDNKIHYSMICKNSDIFTKLETELYKIYPEYIDKNNFFISKGERINKYKSLEQNNIHHNDIIVLNSVSSIIN